MNNTNGLVADEFLGDGKIHGPRTHAADSQSKYGEQFFMASPRREKLNNYTKSLLGVETISLQNYGFIIFWSAGFRPARTTRSLVFGNSSQQPRSALQTPGFVRGNCDGADIIAARFFLRSISSGAGAMTTANCPTCGGLIEFKMGSSFLVVCPHCRSAIARTDRSLEDLGKVAALVDTESPLAIGLQGKYKNASFRLTGRAQLRHSLGGVWDEWYAAFSVNRWGWLAEAQGKFYLTFEEEVPDLPKYESLELGQPVPKVKIPLVVAEKETRRMRRRTAKFRTNSRRMRRSPTPT